jgi:uncharacterized membrane protein (UPF0127 family)
MYAVVGGMFAACGTTTQPQPKPKVAAVSERGLALGDLSILRDQSTVVTFEVEIADTPEVQATGLMGVRHLDDLQGMVFLYASGRRGSFYMKNTLIPLDIAFWDEGGSIVDILQMQPCFQDPCPTYQPSADFVGAIEVNLGVMAGKSVVVGDKANLRRRVPSGALAQLPLPIGK